MKALWVTAVLAASTAAAGCGGEDVEPIPASDAPSVTSPQTTIPYESGGADGSGSDGVREDQDRGGVAAGNDAGSGS